LAPNVYAGRAEYLFPATARANMKSSLDIESYKNEVQYFADCGNYHAALNIALSGLNACRKQHDQAGVDQCLGVIEGVVQQLVHEFGGEDYTNR
jgi:hypothetical protein